MGLSKRHRVRNYAAQIEPARISSSLEFALRFTTANRFALYGVGPTLWRAVRMRVWLEGMQKELQKTAVALRDNPAAVLSRFQKILDRPSYFFKSSAHGDWVLLFGPSAKRALPVPVSHEAAVPTLPLPMPVAPRVFDFVMPQPAWTTRLARQGVLLRTFCRTTLRGLHHWLMHPVIDTREPSEPAN